jgi:rare lipoprotein A (peptidoglycan hydrolase)
MTTALALLAMIIPTTNVEVKHKPKPKPKLPMSTALASWYGDHGGGACGVGDVQSGYRFASLFLRCGSRVRFCHYGNCVNATMSDHGPYVSGRLFDLNANLKYALRCSDLCNVRWRRM